MELRVPGPSDARAVEDMVAEFVADKSPHDGMFADLLPFHYDAWLADNERDLHAPKPGFVPAVQYVSFDESTAAGIGFLSIRLALNDYLLNVGGHIGYSIRPLMRGQGVWSAAASSRAGACSRARVRACADNLFCR